MTRLELSGFPYQRVRREFPNQVYHQAAQDEVRMYFDLLQDNSINNIVQLTGYGRDFVRKSLDDYKNMKIA